MLPPSASFDLGYCNMKKLHVLNVSARSTTRLHRGMVV